MATYFFGSIISNVLTGWVVERYQPHYKMTIPMVCAIKAIIDIPVNLMTYY
jgi:hypothetical protein